MNILIVVRHRQKESGFTLIELMIVIAIMAILTMVAITNITQQIQQSETASAVRNVYSAWADLSSTAVAADGATLERSGSSLVLVSGATASGTGMQTSWSLPESTNISLNGNTFQCLSLNGDAMPINTSWCPTSLTSSTIPNFWLSINGGAYVSAKS